MIRREIAENKSLVKRAACLLLLLPEARSLVRWYQRCWMIRSGWPRHRGYAGEISLPRHYATKNESFGSARGRYSAIIPV
jgi:hypothetical protein